MSETFFRSFCFFTVLFYCSFVNSTKAPITGLTIVGFGQHTVHNDKYVVMLGNGTRIATSINDIKENQGLCKATMADDIYPYHACIYDFNDENIILEYDFISIRKGCTVDLITENNQIEFTFLQHLDDCPKRNEDICRFTSATSDNILPFAYSLNCKEFQKLGKEPLYGEDNATCPNREKCRSSVDDDYLKKKPDCMPFTGLEFEWRCEYRELFTSFFPIGEVNIIDGIKGNISNEAMAVKINITIKEDKIFIGNFAIFINNTWIIINKIKKIKRNKQFNCINSIIKAKMWKIINNKLFQKKNLFTFHLLPIESSRRRWVDRMIGERSSNECDNIKIIFSKKNYLMLTVGPERKEEAKTSLSETTTKITETTKMSTTKIPTTTSTTKTTTTITTTTTTELKLSESTKKLQEIANNKQTNSEEINLPKPTETFNLDKNINLSTTLVFSSSTNNLIGTNKEETFVNYIVIGVCCCDRFCLVYSSKKESFRSGKISLRKIKFQNSKPKNKISEEKKKEKNIPFKFEKKIEEKSNENKKEEIKKNKKRENKKNISYGLMLFVNIL
ncbi:hypothetical protein Mgra_00009127, partial [Meloidogyne graminicola]